MRRRRFAAAADLRGYPLVETVMPDADDAGIQNFAVAADPSGPLYVANLGALLIHDGAHRLIEAADLALYRAKTEGRNRVRVDDGTAGSGAAAELGSN